MKYFIWFYVVEYGRVTSLKFIFQCPFLYIVFEIFSFFYFSSSFCVFCSFNYTYYFSVILCDMLKNIPPGRLTKQKMMTINEIIHSDLFLYTECRRIMLPVFMKQVKALFEISEEVSGAYNRFFINNAQLHLDLSKWLKEIKFQNAAFKAKCTLTYTHIEYNM